MQNDSFIRPDELWNNLGLRAEQTIVHLGCGAGFYLIPAARIVGKEGEAIGIDILPDMLAEVESRAQRERLDEIVKTKRANLEGPKGSGLDDRIADWVLVANILHQSDPKMILQEAERIMAMNGRIVVIEWNTVASPFGPPIAARRAKEEVVHMLEGLGLVVVKDFKPSEYHYGLLVSKNK